MYNTKFNANTIISTVLPLIFGEGIPTSKTRLPEEEDGGTHTRYYRGEDIIRRWEVVASCWKDGAEMVTIESPSFKGDTYVALHAVWSNYNNSKPYLSLYMGGRDWKTEVQQADSIEDQARLLAEAIKEAFDRF